MKTFRAIQNERGFVLLVVYMVVIFAAIYSVVLFARHRGAILATERYQNRILAFNAAESGIDATLQILSTDTDYAGTSAFTPLTPENDAVRCGYTVTVETTAQYNKRLLELHKKSCPSHSDQCTLFASTPEDLNIRIIIANGFSPDNKTTSRAYQMSNITVFCRLPEPATPSSSFTHGVYAEDRISLSGNSAFDSYNSINGAYGGSNKSSAGEMAVNSTLSGKMSLTGNSKINGSVYIGYNGVQNAVITTTQNSTITGTRSNLPQTWISPVSVEVPEGAPEPTNLSVSGNTTKQLPGSSDPENPVIYHYTSLKVSGNGKITTTGAVKIYVDGEIDITGNGITVPNNRPVNLLLFSSGPVNPVTGFAPSVKIAGNGSFYGGVYAPKSAVLATGNGDIFGAVVSKTYTQGGNSATHADLSLVGQSGAVSSEPDPVHITAWQELNSLAWGTGEKIT